MFTATVAVLAIFCLCGAYAWCGSQQRLEKRGDSCYFKGESDCHRPDIHRQYDPRTHPDMEEETVPMTFITSRNPFKGGYPWVSRTEANSVLRDLNRQYAGAKIRFTLNYMVLNSLDWKVFYNASPCKPGDGKCDTFCTMNRDLELPDGGDCLCNSAITLRACANTTRYPDQASFPYSCTCQRWKPSPAHCGPLANNGRCDQECNGASGNWDGGDCCNRQVQMKEGKWTCVADYMTEEQMETHLAKEIDMTLVFAQRHVIYLALPMLGAEGVLLKEWPFKLPNGRTRTMLYGATGAVTSSFHPKREKGELDLKILSHELGHLFGLMHTHSAQGSLSALTFGDPCGDSCRSHGSTFNDGDYLPDTLPEPVMAGRCDSQRDPCNSSYVFTNNALFRLGANMMSYGGCYSGKDEDITPDQYTSIRCHYERYMKDRLIGNKDWTGAEVTEPGPGEVVAIGKQSARVQVIVAAGDDVDHFQLVPAALFDSKLLGSPSEKYSLGMFSSDYARFADKQRAGARLGGMRAHKSSSSTVRRFVWDVFRYGDGHDMLRKGEYVLAARVKRGAPPAAAVPKPAAPAANETEGDYDPNSGCYEYAGYRYGRCGCDCGSKRVGVKFSPRKKCPSSSHICCVLPKRAERGTTGLRGDASCKPVGGNKATPTTTTANTAPTTKPKYAAAQDGSEWVVSKPFFLEYTSCHVDSVDAHGICRLAAECSERGGTAHPAAERCHRGLDTSSLVCCQAQEVRRAFYEPLDSLEEPGTAEFDPNSLRNDTVGPFEVAYPGPTLIHGTPMRATFRRTDGEEKFGYMTPYLFKSGVTWAEATYKEKSYISLEDGATPTEKTVKDGLSNINVGVGLIEMRYNISDYKVVDGNVQRRVAEYRTKPFNVAYAPCLADSGAVGHCMPAFDCKKPNEEVESVSCAGLKQFKSSKYGYRCCVGEYINAGIDFRMTNNPEDYLEDGGGDGVPTATVLAIGGAALAVCLLAVAACVAVVVVRSRRRHRHQRGGDAELLATAGGDASPKASRRGTAASRRGTYAPASRRGTYTTSGAARHGRRASNARAMRTNSVAYAHMY